MNKAIDTTKSIHLSASAGSGKTRALKERYLAILDVLDRRGLNIDQAVAITFTDRAAAEIKKRVMNGLPEGMLKKIIRGRQDLRISTNVTSMSTCGLRRSSVLMSLLIHSWFFLAAYTIRENVFLSGTIRI